MLNETLTLQQSPYLLGDLWRLSVTRDDPAAVALYTRHYSCTNRAVRKMGGPGRYIGLMTLNRDALFLWIEERYRFDGQTGINCSIFRNEGKTLSSLLIEEACQIAWRKWPGQRLYTYINASKIESDNPGYCFKLAGFKKAGRSKTGLILLERMS